MAEKKMIIDGIECPFTNERNVLEVARNNGIDIPSLCYCENLILENCTFEPDANLAFEYSSVQATVKGAIHSVKNPRSGFIKADKIGQIILDQNIKQPANCEIQL